ncbi:5-oxoprolinase subunit PxpB [Sabulilitoribacter arenilitoris]|uniref:5-oxoprolinase subunit PxpB n=1 Tax=Wocania arenilitoris TaxID=2044858 RepID=A0AAE3EQ12_9FLAO|nr:5-oxoprolinase subunit PxpB [Wocania arenilitoris]MCF7567960.1 5-oxoprolinase subunit PxpB [Wocania arenilitoris]
MIFNLTYKPYGERSILVEWPQVINKKILYDVLAFKNKILKNDIELIIDINTAYNSLLITYKKIKTSFNTQVSILKETYSQENIYNKQIFKQWEIPVCYDVDFGVDLKTISLAKNTTKEFIIKQHSQAIYTVYFIGFLPGFLYLGGLHKALCFPRKETPKLQIEKGAVAIGGNQTGIYPSESPGGWNIIGNTPISFFNVTKNNACFAKPGDSIKFYSISLKKYHDIKSLVDAGVYQIKSEVVNG